MDGVDVVLSAVELTKPFYEVSAVEQSGNEVRVRSHACPMWEAAKRLAEVGLPGDAFCRPHELYYQDLVDDLRFPISFKFTKALGRGDDCCEWVIRIHRAGTGEGS